MKKAHRNWAAFFIFLLIMPLLSACQSAAPINCASVHDFCVGLVGQVGKIDDLALNQMAWAGVKKAELKLGIHAKSIETIDSRDYEKNIATFANAGYDLIITVGYDQAKATLAAAIAYPQINFIGVDQPLETDKSLPPNLTGLSFAEDQLGFLAGVLAAQMTKAQKVGAVCGPDFLPTAWRYCEGFKAGVGYVNNPPTPEPTATRTPKPTKTLIPSAGGTAPATPTQNPFATASATPTLGPDDDPVPDSCDPDLDPTCPTPTEECDPDVDSACPTPEGECDPDVDDACPTPEGECDPDVDDACPTPEECDPAIDECNISYDSPTEAPNDSLDGNQHARQAHPQNDPPTEEPTIEAGTPTPQDPSLTSSDAATTPTATGSPTVEAIVVYHNEIGFKESPVNPKWDADSANTLMDGGVDVIFGADSYEENGAISAAAKRYKYAIGVNTDQYFTIINAQGMLLSSVIKRVDDGVFNLIRLTQAGKFPGGNFQGAVGYAPFHDLSDRVPAPLRKILEDFERGLADGSIETDVLPHKP